MIRPSTALAVLALLAVGCSSSPSDSTTATTAGASTSTTLSRDQQGVRFAECMRTHDVPHFPDPDPDGDFTFGVDVTPEVWLQALTACKDLQPPGTLSGDRTPQQQSAALRMAQCVRDHGVPDFPDPVDGEPLIDTDKIPSANRPGGMAILNAATKACGELLDDAATHR